MGFYKKPNWRKWIKWDGKNLSVKWDCWKILSVKWDWVTPINTLLKRFDRLAAVISYGLVDPSLCVHSRSEDLGQGKFGLPFYLHSWVWLIIVKYRTTVFLVKIYVACETCNLKTCNLKSEIRVGDNIPLDQINKHRQPTARNAGSYIKELSKKAIDHENAFIIYCRGPPLTRT